ncbi:IS256 family transposase [Burkholderia cenocepacia]|jgi:transposase-like protein|uniref:IS256 family transposase n=1 Tax=Burkholderia cepacia complex TaxID=87882 RepID=UPI001588B466|nr:MULTISPECIES: IS256 family transposase [Burkholderia cepacia complex]MBR8386728.1 IS256 family transposase [Burkholderia cenocepacia]MDN7631743.1 IS256 family transposase [Burkholderia cenocepacia]HDR9354527.1 IS256 family transposase [Burkholderia vietnamiensis]
MAKRTQEENNSQATETEFKALPGLDDLIQQGARQIIQQAIEAELAALLERYSNVKTLDGRRAVVRNGYLPEREVVTAIGPVPVQVPKVRDRSGSGVKFNSSLVPPYVRRSPRVSAALPWLYLRGVSTGDMSEALSVLVGEDAKGLSPNVVVRLKAQWAEEFEQWTRRDLKQARWVYWWADGIHTGARSEDSDGQCLLVIIGVKPDGSKERVAIADGYRESKASWRDLLLDLKARGLQVGPLLAAGDGAMGLWAALEEVFPQTKQQRCWFHKIGNVLNALPKAQHGRAKTDLAQIWNAATRAEALVAFERFVATYGAKYPKAVEKLTKDRNELLAFYDFPAEHWQHLRTTNPIESTFATVRHRTSRARNCLSRATFLGMAFKLVESAEQSWRRIRGAERIEQLLKGIPFEDGIPVIESAPAQQPLAA